jgi:membrane protease YdiL (CAAX protease family)
MEAMDDQDHTSEGRQEGSAPAGFRPQTHEYFVAGQRPARVPDPGSPVIARIAGVLVVLLIGLVAFLQQTSESAAVKAVGHKAAEAQAAVAPPPLQFEVMAKIYTKIQMAFPDLKLGDGAVQALDEQADRPEQRLRAAIVAGELLGVDAAENRLAPVEKEIGDDDSPLREDIATIRRIYAGGPVALSPEELKGLEDRHGWFGRLVATHGEPLTDPAREAVAGGGGALVGVLSTVAIIAVTAVLTGLVLLIVGIVKAATRTLWPRFVPPAPGGSVMIETVAVFVGGFLLFKVGTGVIAGIVGEGAALGVVLVGQWLLIGLLFWPVLRGVGLRRTMELYGLHRGRGVLREIGCGILGYLACLPLLVGGVIVSVTLMMAYALIRRLMGASPPPTPENPVIDIVAGGQGSWLVVMLFLLASLWAPLVEETVFRGALYRHLRAGWHWLPAGIVTALGFGLMHGYPIILLGPVIALGFGFAMMREWRGSIIPSMTAHCLHNATVLAVLITVANLLGN